MVTRELLFRPGEPFDSAEVQETVRNLRGLGIFRRVLWDSVRTDTGLEGIGEADSSPEVVKAIVDAPFSHNVACGLRQLLVGENPLETERLWWKMHRGTIYFGRTSVTPPCAVQTARARVGSVVRRR